MPQSLVKIPAHIIFSTKNRRPLINSNVQSDLFAYVAGICNQLKSFPHKVGGYHDHIHILTEISKTITVSDLIREIKVGSSKWMKTKLNNNEFSWQSGYAAFAVQYNLVDVVSSYIVNQNQHHQKISFQTELRQLLNENQMEYDERYLWD